MVHKRQTFGLAFLLLLSACGESEQSAENVAEENFMGESMIASRGSPTDLVWCEVLEQQVPRNDCEIISKTAQVTDGSAALNVPDPMQRGDRTSVMLVVDRRPPNVIHGIDAAAVGNETVAVNAVEPADGPDATTNAADNAVAGEDVPPTSPSNVTDPEPPSPEIRNPTPKQQTDKLSGTTDTYDLKVGRRMRADLEGQGFTIARQSPAVQDIPMGDQGTWTWEVIATQGGPKSLTVTTVVEAAVNGRVYQLRQTKHLKKVTVGVSFIDRIKDWLRGLPELLQLIAAALTALAGVAGAWWLIKRNWRNGPGTGDASAGDGQ